jgi:IclR family pca regulon transcriptional regulator
VGRLPEGMGGLAKGLAIIEAFSPRRTRLTVTEAAQSSGTSRASARRCLLTLTELGYLEFDGKYFRPQPRLLALSAGYSGTRALPQIAQSFLKAARDQIRESISLAVLDGESALFVARSEAERLVTTGISVGTRIDLYCSATVVFCSRLGPTTVLPTTSSGPKSRLAPKIRSSGSRLCGMPCGKRSRRAMPSPIRNSRWASVRSRFRCSTCAGASWRP